MGKRFAVVVGVAAAGVMAFGAQTPVAASHQVSYSTGLFSVSCDTADSTPQICDPAEKLKVKVKHGKVRIKRLRYGALTEHCSAGRVRVKRDGDAIGQTDYVNAGEWSTIDDLKVTLGPGQHEFAFRFQGKTGGCNAGFVGSWGGEITLKGKNL